jgi:hypothetical protein
MARSWRDHPRTLQNLHIQPRRHGAKREGMAHPCNCTFSLYFTMISCFRTLGIMRFAWFSIPACYFYNVFSRARRAIPYRRWVYPAGRNNCENLSCNAQIGIRNLEMNSKSLRCLRAPQGHASPTVCLRCLRAP